MKKIKKVLALACMVFSLGAASISFSACSSNSKQQSTSSEIIKDGKNVYFAGPMFMQVFMITTLRREMKVSLIG